MKKGWFGVLVAGVALVGASGPGLAATTGAETFRTITYGNTPPNTRRVFGIGPINGAGTEKLLGMQPLPNGSTQVKLEWDFPAGNVFVTMVSFQNFQGDPVPPTCEATANVSGTYTITGGTGAYAGVSGGGTVTGVGQVFAVYDPVTKTCSEDQANLFLNQKTLTGSVSLP